MPEPATVKAIIGRAQNQGKEYDWSGAVESYKEALSLVPERDFSGRAEVCEALGYGAYRGAMQSENQEEFRERIRQAAADYEQASKFHAESSDRLKEARVLRCNAMVAYAGYWLASSVQDKKRLISECWTLTKRALNIFEEAGEAYEHGKTYNRLSTSLDFGFFLEKDYRAREKMIKEAVEHGEKAVTFLIASGDAYELARAYVRTATYLEVSGVYFLGQSERETNFKKATGYWRKANELSEEAAMTELISVQAGPSWDWGEGTDKAMDNFKKALEYAKRSKDKFAVGCAMDFLAYHTCWRARATEDPDKRLELAKTGLQYAEDARGQYSVISFTSPSAGVIWVESPYAEHYWRLASFEANLSKRRELLEKAAEAAPEMLKRAEDSRIPDLIHYAHHVFSKILAYLARIETNPDSRKAFLEKSLEHRNEAIRIIEQLNPYHYWDLGVMQGSLANIKTDLVDLLSTPEAKNSMLQEAIINKENSINLSLKWMTLYGEEPSVSLFADLGPRQYQLGDLLNRLYELTDNKDYLPKAIKAFEDAAQTYHKLNLKSRVAECCWKEAQTHDTLGQHSRAAEGFGLASKNYLEAAERIPQLKDLYRDYGLYMQAWSEIERARQYHARQEYGSAREHFEKAAEMHKSSRKWSYLHPNFSAWAQVEQAEELSRNERTDEARNAFEEAARLFEETKKTLRNELPKIEDLDEKQMAGSMLKATDLRHEYCVARATVEEAKMLDRKGDHYSSSEKYGSAAENLEKITQRLESDEDKKEFRYIKLLLQAWQRMTQAEAEAQPTLYVEASKLFEEAKEQSPNERTKMLMLGHSRLCRALEAGARFSDTRDTVMHASAIQHLESAANYYVKAGFKDASEYVKATGLLFDAYVYMDNAKKESDPVKRTQLYTMAEKVLQTAAFSYEKAGHLGKKEHALRLLEKVKDEREIAVSLTEVLHAPIIASTTAFPAPTSTYERAVGLEVFEHAEIRASITARQKELKVGENLEMEIELVNAGKGAALLTKITETIPDGFELREKSGTYRVEDSYLNMKGRRLDPLKTEEVRLVLRPNIQGTFLFRPKILYFDENGECKSHEPQPITITVKELGIKGWLKGER
jgi:hypothetical protein